MEFRNKILQGNSLDMLSQMPDECVHMAVTSPPYFGLRSYDAPPTVWDGSPDCSHEWSANIPAKRISHWETWEWNDGRPANASKGWKEKVRNTKQKSYGSFCLKCGAWKGCLGQEPSMEMYIKHLNQIFTEVKRVLRKDGTFWLNIGDSYAGSGSHSSDFREEKKGDIYLRPYKCRGVGLKTKDQCLIPHRVALTLQGFAVIYADELWKLVDALRRAREDKDWDAVVWVEEVLRRWALATKLADLSGWWVRSTIIWKKSNSLPSNANDRPANNFEYVFLLSKSKRYYYDAEAIKEPQKEISIKRAFAVNHLERRKDNGKRIYSLSSESQKKALAKLADSVRNGEQAMRHKRCVWTIPTHAFKEAHFACVDSETECLTPSGWRNYQDLNIGSLIASYNHSSKRLRWEPIEMIAKYEYDDELYVLGGRDLGFRVTPNHRCLVRTKKKNESVRHADRLVGGLEVPTITEWENGTYGGYDDPGSSIAGLLGWVIAEGHYTKYGVIIYQSDSANPHNVKKIRKLLNDCGVKYSENIQYRTYNNRPSNLARFAITWEHAQIIRSYLRNKKPRWDMLQWSKESLQAIWDAMVDGDGHRRLDGRVSFVQYSKETSDWFQALSVRLGYRAILSPRKNRGFTVYTVKRRWHSLRGTNGIGAILRKEKYKGIVWCPSVFSGFWLARRNGRIIITGNTFPPRIVEPMILAGSSPKVCAECGAPWKRVKEDNNGFEWYPTCDCNAGTTKAIVLDPFMGAGTTALVATELGRDFVGIEIGEKYIEMANRRLDGIMLPLSLGGI